MSTYSLSQLSDQILLDQLAALVATDRQTTAALLAHIAEVDARKLFLPAACSSMYIYCVQVLRLSEDAACRRITAARAARRFPAILAGIADGRLTLDAVSRLAPRLTDANAGDLLAAAAYRTRAGIELLLAERFPRPDVPAHLEPLPAPAPGLAPARAEPASKAVTRTEPLSPRRFALRLTIEQATRDKLERAQALLRHRVPSGDLAQVVDRALDALLASLERERFAATERPRAGKARPADADPRYVPHEVKRAVHQRDGERCSFVSAAGERCAERGFLEIDHIDPVARGGQPTRDRARLLCASHNLYEAERVLGAAFMQGRRDRARAAAAAARAGSPAPARAPDDANRPSGSPAPARAPDDANRPSGSPAPARAPDDANRPSGSPAPARAPDDANRPSGSPAPARAPDDANRPSGSPAPARAPDDANRPSGSPAPARAPDDANRPSAASQVDARATEPTRTPGEAEHLSTMGQVVVRENGPARAPGDQPDHPMAALAPGTPGRACDGAAAREMEADVLAGLRGLGFSAADARRAVARSAPPAAMTLEQRLRAALAVLRATCAGCIADGSPERRDVAGSWPSRPGRTTADHVRCARPMYVPTPGRSSSRPILGRSHGP